MANHETEILTLTSAALFDPRAAVEAVQIVTGRVEAFLTTLRREIERAPWHDADPDARAGAVSRVAIMGHLLEQSEEDLQLVRCALGAIAVRVARVA